MARPIQEAWSRLKGSRLFTLTSPRRTRRTVETPAKRKRRLLRRLFRRRKDDDGDDNGGGGNGDDGDDDDHFKGSWITSSQLRALIAEQLAGKINKGTVLYLADGQYLCPSLPDLKKILANSATNKFKYKATDFDCDDFSKMLWSDFARASYADDERYPLCCGIVWGNLPGPHAINWVVTNDGAFRFIEPQSDKIFAPRKTDKGIYLMVG